MAKGNHIYVSYPGFSHHGIDCGDGTVIHYQGKHQGGKIVQTSKTCFAQGNRVRIRKYATCDRPALVIQRAKSRLGECGYNLFDNNCEHFATWCKTGASYSEQVKNAGATGGGVVASGAAVSTSIGVVSAAGTAVGLSGAGIISGLATVGGVVGGGAVAGAGILSVAPGAIATAAMNQVLCDDENLSTGEREARAVGRTMTAVGAVAGTAGAVSTVAATGSVAGLSAAGITSGLAAVGGTVGGGMAAGVAVTVAAPAVAAAAVGWGAYTIWKWLSD